MLCWIQNERQWKQYVSHCADEIRRLTGKESWRVCLVTQNPADLPSRGLSAEDLVNSSLWWEGPQFLRQPEGEAS